MSSTLTNWRSALFRLALFALLVALLLRQVDLSLVLNYFRPDLLVAATAIQPLVAVSFLFGALRLRLLVGPDSARFTTVLNALLLSSGMNLLLPGRLSEVLKVTYLRDHDGVAASAGLAAVFLERLTDIIILGILAVASIWLALADPGPGFVVLMIAAVATLLALPLLEMIVSAAVRIIPGAWLREMVMRVNTQLVARVKDRTIYGALGYGACLWLSSLANVYLFLHISGNASIGISGALVIFVLSMVGGAIPALPGGFGTYEAAVVFALKGYGYSVEEAIPIALAMHAGQLFLSSVAAAWIVVTETTGVRSLTSQITAVLRSRQDS